MHCDTKLKCSFIPASKSNFTKGRDNIHIHALILHYTVESLAKTLNIFADPQRQVSAHYLVDTKGNIIQLVREKDTAYHAGISNFAGINGLNRSSIGIEIVNKGYYESNESEPIDKFKDKQILAVIKLCKDIITRYNIPKFLILGHADIALGRAELDHIHKRKIDPGPYFPWRTLAKHGIGLFPLYLIKPSPLDNIHLSTKANILLHQYGYDTHDLSMAEEGFQIHFNPNEYINKLPFSALDVAILRQLIAMKNTKNKHK